MNKTSAQEIAPVILRIGIALVFLWFGSQQLMHTSMWVGFIPKWVLSMSGLTAITMVHFNGAFEIVFGLLLLIGYQTRIVAALLALHLASITMDVGFNAIGVRDFGLTVAAFAVAFYGATKMSLDARMAQKSGMNDTVVANS